MADEFRWLNPSRAGSCCLLFEVGQIATASSSERSKQPSVWRCLGTELVVTSSHMVDQAMVGHDDPGSPIPLRSSHGPQPGLQPSVVGLHCIVGVLLHVVERTGQDLVEHGRVDTGWA